MIGKHAAPNEVGLTQSLGQVDAWTSRPSAYAVLARTTDDVVAAVNFARGEQFAARREGWWSFFFDLGDEVLTPGSFQNVHALSDAMLNYVAQHALRC